MGEGDLFVLLAMSVHHTSDSSVSVCDRTADCTVVAHNSDKVILETSPVFNYAIESRSFFF